MFSALQLNAEVLGVSVDSKFTHLAWLNTPLEKGGLASEGNQQFRLPLLSDISHSISRSYGVLNEEEGTMISSCFFFFLIFSSVSDNCNPGYSKRCVFIISDKGLVREIISNDDGVGRSVDETLRILQAILYSDTNEGQACPVNWKPGNHHSFPLYLSSDV